MRHPPRKAHRVNALLRIRIGEKPVNPRKSGLLLIRFACPRPEGSRIHCAFDPDDAQIASKNRPLRVLMD
jgi:hypothetical protein